MRLLVTGGAGFIGSNFVRRLLSGAYEAFADRAWWEPLRTAVKAETGHAGETAAVRR